MGEGEPNRGQPVDGGRPHGGAHGRLEPARALEDQAAEHAAEAAGEQQHAVGRPRGHPVDAARDRRHDGLHRRADEERSEPGEDDHGDQHRAHHERGQRQIEQDVAEDALDRSEAEQQGRPHDRAEEDAQAARGRIQPHGARQLGRADEVLEHQLLGRCPQRARGAVQDQQHARVPDPQRAGREQDAPGPGPGRAHDRLVLTEQGRAWSRHTQRTCTPAPVIAGAGSVIPHGRARGARQKS